MPIKAFSTTEIRRESRRRFTVIQVGARLHYAVPALFARAGMLERFYTDIHAGDWPVRIGLKNRWSARSQAKPVQRLLGRHLPPEIASKTASMPCVALWKYLRGASCEPNLRTKVLRDGFGDADALYTLSNGDIDVVRAARNSGLLIVHEQILNPDVGRILREERTRFPGIEPQASLERIACDEQMDRRQWSAADLLLAPSEFVRKGMIAMGADGSRTTVVEYGISEDWFDVTPAPMPGRVLFVGTVGLRKGSHYVAEAKRILARRGVTLDFRVVGPAAPGIVQRGEFEGPTYLGQIPRSLVAEEFRRADIFVLPTLSDSFALVHLEAMACGVPVITTPNCGSVVRDGIDGFIVPIRDPESFADKIENLVSHRVLRQRMSWNARQRAREFTWARYGERLLAAIAAAETRERPTFAFRP